MVYKTHVSFALCLSLSITLLLEININLYQIFKIYPFLSIYHYVIFTIGILIGSLFPDIDIPQSYISKRLKYLSVIFSSLFKHRGPTHFILFYFIILEVLSFIDMNYTVKIYLNGFFIGCIFHIFGDAVTNNGIKNGWFPFPFDFVILPKFLRFSVNGKIENLIFKLLFLINVYLIFKVSIYFMNITSLKSFFNYISKDLHSLYVSINSLI